MITFTLTTEEADRLHELLAFNADQLTEQINGESSTYSDGATVYDDEASAIIDGLALWLDVASRVKELIEAETVEGMIERGEIEQGALADKQCLVDLYDADVFYRFLKAEVTLADGTILKPEIIDNQAGQRLYIDLSNHLDGNYWFWAIPDWMDYGTITFCLQDNDSGAIIDSASSDASAVWTGNLATDLEAYTSALQSALRDAVNHIPEPPSYGCPVCRRGMMTAEGQTMQTYRGLRTENDQLIVEDFSQIDSGFFDMRCDDCGHTEQVEAD